MRIRSTKPEFWRSKTIALLPWDVRLVLKGLESYVDDNGVGKDDIALIAADVFPRDLSASPRDTLARLSEAISLLVERGLVARYTADGEDLLYIDRWKDLQRIDKPANGRFPRPDGTLKYAEVVDRASYRGIRESVARVPEVVAPGTGEQGNRGTEEQGNSSSSDSADAEIRHEVVDLLDLLDQRVTENGHRKPSRTQRNIRAIELMLDRDGLNADEIRRAILWATSDEFWRGNIRSASTLRDKFSQLRSDAQRKNNPRTPQHPNLSNADRAALEYQELYGGGDERAGGFQALDASFGS